MPTAFHPFLVHFPIALLSLAFVLDLPFGSETQKDDKRSWAWKSWIFGTAGAVIAATVGIYEHFAYLKGPAVEAIEAHQLWGLAAAVSALALVMWRGYMRHLQRPDPGHQGLGIALGAVVIVFLFLAAQSGGALVFEYGVAVQSP